MPDVTVSGSVGRALLLVSNPTEREAVSTQEYRDSVEQGILDIAPEVAPLLMDYDGELVSLRAVLALGLAADLLARPLRTSDAADAINWYRELDATRATAPKTWARAQCNLGAAWLRRPNTDRQSAAREAIAALERAATIFTVDADPADWAGTVIRLAEAQRELEPDGNATSVRTLEQAVRDAPPGLAEPWRLKLRSSLGGALTREAERGEAGAGLERAIVMLEEVVARSRSVDPELCANAEVNLGHAYGLRAERGSRTGWGEAIDVLEDALSIFDSAGKHEPWAAAANNLGIMLLHRPDGDRGQNLARAKDLFERTIAITHADGTASRWAGAQNNLGTVLLATPTGDADANVDAACRAYESALTVWTKQAHPLEWALTTARLAMAEWNRVDPDQGKVAALYRAALDGLDPGKYPVHWARTASLSADVLSADEQDRTSSTDSLRRSIRTYETAIAIFLDRGSRFDAATAEHNRAIAAYRLAVIPGEAAYFDVARRALQHARELRGADEVPRDWAMTTTLLAELEIVAGRPDKAEPLFRQALDVLTVGGESALILRTATGLARALAGRGNWAGAVTAFDTAMQSLEEMFSSAVVRSSKQRVLGRASGAVVEAAYAYAKAGDAFAAARILEHGRARLLADALQRRDDQFDVLADSHPEQYRQYQGDAVDLERAETAALRLAATVDPGSDDRYRRQAEREVRLALLDARERFTRSGAVLRGLLRTVATVGDDGTTVAYLLTTRWGSLSLVVEPAGVDPVWAPDYLAGDLAAALQGSDGSPGLLDAPLIGSGGVDRVLADVLPRLGQDLLRPLGDHLRAGAAITLVACGGLSQLPLHAAPYRATTFGEHVVVSYAPSRAVLASCRDAADEARSGTAFAVVNPTGDLRYASCESATLLAHVSGTPLEGSAASCEAVATGWTNSSVALFACHGRSVPEEPLRSHLVLADGDLSLVELSAGTADAAPALVLASACQTAVVDARELPDEFVGLPAGFLLSGVAAFIGTLWPAGDVPAALMTMRLIQLLFPRDRSVAAPPPALALQQSSKWLRELTGDEFIVFAAANPALQIVARTQLAFAARFPAQRPYSAPSAWAAHVLIGAG